MFVDLPSLLEQLDAVAGCNDRSLGRLLARRCLEQSNACARSLVDWIETSAPQGWGMAGCSSLDYDNATPDGVKDAHLMCLFWTTYAQVLTVIRSISSLSPAGPNTDMYESTILACCQSIARTVPIFFVGEADVAGCHPIVSFPMFFALQGLLSTESPAASEDRLRLLALFTKSAKGGGSLARFVLSLLEHSPVLQRTEAAKAVATLASEEPLSP